jgi:hypothetical protein
MRTPARIPRAITVFVAAISVAGALVAFSPAASAAGCQAWTGAQPPDPAGPSQQNDLNGVAVVSSCDAWAVGQDGATLRTQAVRWNGSSWVLTPTPDPSATGLNVLNSVAATSASNAWAVGEYRTGTAHLTLIAHWNGHAWKQQASPDPSATDNSLFAVAATSASNAWAVGSYRSGPAIVTLVVHWNGTSWRHVPSPPNSVLLGVAATSPANAWAVGYSTSGAVQQTLILHWNGARWRRVPSPDPSASIQVLDGVAATSASNAWAVGEYANSGSFFEPLVLHWNGKTWKRTPLPKIFSASANNQLFSVAATSARNAWAVGDFALNQTLILHWNGTSWRRESSPNLSARDFLSGVAAASASDAWAVGAYNNGTADQNLALHCC